MTGSVTRSEDRLSFTDQAMFLGLRATGQEAVMQCVWIYERPIDYDGVRRFYEGIGHGVFGRRIERSPLPFGRHRWVSAPGPQAELDIAEARTRGELGAWVDERAAMALDPERGPGWHMGVLPMTDGSTAICLVGSHCLGDGGGGILTILDAVYGNKTDFNHPPPVSRTRWRAIRSDLGETVRGVPEVARTVVAAAKLARRRRGDISRSGAARPRAVAGADERVYMPAVTAYVNAEDWHLRAKTLGGNSYSLVAGVAARLAEAMGRVRDEDGAVTLNIPQNDRTLECMDTRANAVRLVNVAIDPATVTTDLSGARAAIKAGLASARDNPDETLQLLPLTPFIPKRVVRKMADMVFGFAADLPVSCSNMGEVPAAVALADGTEADYLYFRGIDRYATRGALEQRRGLLTVVACQVDAKVSLSIVAYQPGGENSTPWLHALVAETLADFELTGVIE
ncbi:MULTISPECIES: hypothetical protein [Mycolicibacterium]|uniref:Fatty acyl-AMP ligase FadD28 and polyketide synthase n=1 Tax=Mycolicibacterium senegalense TaxID=1796 RepID=A0A378T1M4_9MYCO|nr:MULTISPECIES: hypothetical protein [Mycolicibacterium]MCV7334990.1 hypothetical protein [Mycolicibacterium senegalense]MDR7289921.1 hypothetical protein [Mycolicibacterium senegalense]QZA26707.1 hypothetical protein K3U95_12070 [Mycolicibacterium senegalense]CDP82561.1 Fatty acyl-AMP ligase FadD28 and polyketide synthase [Mycolicibacterium farcinogenes]STZ54722.1 Fatty acyl-AMP ligase FadD28 and polyketide synthase [Mycolicibacterium senegalense]